MSNIQWEAIAAIVAILTLAWAVFVFIIGKRKQTAKVFNSLFKTSKAKPPQIAVVLCQDMTSIAADVYLPRVLDGIQSIAHDKGFDVIVKSKNDPTLGRIEQFIQEREIQGIIVSGPRDNDKDFIERAEKLCPLLLLGSLGDFPHVDINNRDAVKKAIRHLIKDHNYDSIAMITNSPDHYTASRDRIEGYKQALVDLGHPDDGFLIECGGFHSQSGYEAMKRLLSRSEPPRAVFIASDVVAFGAMQYLLERDLSIPEEVAIVGFDDVALAKYVDPPLTTVRLPAYKQGRTSATLLISAIQGKKREIESTLLSTKLVRRVSCGCTCWIDKDGLEDR